MIYFFSAVDQWRVPLKDERPDYIHASFASDHRQKEAFIIAQAPLEETCRDFWKMVHERECGAIVMLSGQVEQGRVRNDHQQPLSVQIVCDKHTNLGRRNAVLTGQFVFFALAKLDICGGKSLCPFLQTASGGMSEVLANN
jgi:protein tyrosine phosphatase